MRTEIQLSPKAVELINELLTEGRRVMLDYNPKHRELTIYEVPRKKMKYRVVISGGR